jgi:hypothetical protein
MLPKLLDQVTNVTSGEWGWPDYEAVRLPPLLSPAMSIVDQRGDVMSRGDRLTHRLDDRSPTTAAARRRRPGPPACCDPIDVVGGRRPGGLRIGPTSG